MGEADSTTNVGNYGLSIFNYYQTNKFEPFIEDMTEEYVDKDDMKFLLTDYSNSLATTAISKYFDEYLHSNSTLEINAIDLNNFLRKVIIMFKDDFPKHCAWEEPEWIIHTSREEFKNKCKHEKDRGNVVIY